MVLQVVLQGETDPAVIIINERPFPDIKNPEGISFPLGRLAELFLELDKNDNEIGSLPVKEEDHGSERISPSLFDSIADLFVHHHLHPHHRALHRSKLGGVFPGPQRRSEAAPLP